MTFPRPARSAARSPFMQALEDRRLFSGVPHFDHIVVVIEENHSPSHIIGSASAPYITSLANNGALMTNAHGVSRPSEPNYLAMFSGSTQGVTDDGVHTFGTANLATELSAAGKSYVAYSEGLPYAGFTGATSGRYARKHNAVASFSNVPAAANQPFTSFPADYSSLPAVSFVAPNLDDDSHDGSVAASDSWLQQKMGAYATWAKAHNSLLVVTYDEGDGTDASNQIATIFYGASVKVGTYGNTVNHYSLLRTLEDANGVAPLASAASAAPIDYIWNTVTPPTGLPAAPTNATATAVSGTQINVAWTDNANNETGYKIERSTDGVNYTVVAGTSANFMLNKNTNLTPGKKYYYRVYAINAAGRSAYSNVVSAVTPTGTTTTPAAPTALAASATSASQINLTWSDNSTNESGFRIDRSTDGTTFAMLTNVAANVKTYSNAGLAAATKYYYRVQAIGSPSSSAFSNVASATTFVPTTPPGTGVPAAPTGLTLKKSTSVANAIDLSWTDNAANETGYQIQRSTDGTNFVALAGGGANMAFYRNTTLTAGKKYYYRVYATNAAGKSAFSNVASLVL